MRTMTPYQRASQREADLHFDVLSDALRDAIAQHGVEGTASQKELSPQACDYLEARCRAWRAALLGEDDRRFDELSAASVALAHKVLSPHGLAILEQLRRFAEPEQAALSVPQENSPMSLGARIDHNRLLELQQQPALMTEHERLYVVLDLLEARRSLKSAQELLDLYQGRKR